MCFAGRMVPSAALVVGVITFGVQSVNAAPPSIEWKWDQGSPSAPVVDPNATPKKYKIECKGKVRYAAAAIEIVSVQFRAHAYNLSSGGYDTDPTWTTMATLGNSVAEALPSVYSNMPASTFLKNAGGGVVEVLGGDKYKIVVRITYKQNGVAQPAGDFEPTGFVEAGQ